MHDPRDLRDLLGDELRTRRELGYDVAAVGLRVARAIAEATGPDDPALDALYEELERAPLLPGAAAATEPMDAAASLASLPPATPVASGIGRDYEARIRGAWLGRCAGCMVGKPIEGWGVTEIRTYLEVAGAWPLRDYVPRLDPQPDGTPPMKPAWPRATRGAIAGVARDDDIDYTILGLMLVEERGTELTTDDMADAFLARLPFTQVYTAERVAYRNLVDGLRPPRSATHRNPYREWIGALIRADIHGYVSPGDPRRAATLAARDAAVTHTGVGIHAAMWAAALLAACLATEDPLVAIGASLDQVPPGSRLAREITDVIARHRAGVPWESAWRGIAERHAGTSWVHALNNAALIAAALLWGDDFATAVGLAATAGLDADSAAATVGSAFGALHGAAAIPDRFTEPLGDRVETAVFGIGSAAISDLAARTVRAATGMRPLAGIAATA